jgi:serine/threonine protein kinase
MSKLTKKGNKKIDLNTYCGTIDFMAPEVLLNQNYDLSCDIWSIGVIAFVMLSGYLPF